MRAAQTSATPDSPRRCSRSKLKQIQRQVETAKGSRWFTRNCGNLTISPRVEQNCPRHNAGLPAPLFARRPIETQNSSNAVSNVIDSRDPDEFLWREGDLVVLDRTAGAPLPPICLLTGEPASHRVACLFHWRGTLASPGVTPLHSLANLVQFYFRDVAKMRLAIPLATRLYRRWLLGWGLTALAVVVAVVTICGLFFGQQAIQRLPAGPDKKFLNDLGIPLLALGGFAGIASPTLIAYRVMPMLTVRLVPACITPERIWMRGACPEYLAQLSQRGSTLPGEPGN